MAVYLLAVGNYQCRATTYPASSIIELEEHEAAHLENDAPGIFERYTTRDAANERMRELFPEIAEQIDMRTKGVPVAMVDKQAMPGRKRVSSKAKED